MKLQDMLAAVEPLTIVGEQNPDVSGLAYDSRQVGPGGLFFALPGVKVDGFDFIPQALDLGAAAVVAERVPDPVPEGATFVRVANARKAMALMGAAYYGHPSQDIPVIGITGTNGKTTITYLLEEILKQAGHRPAVFGTIEYRCADLHLESSHTTPESLELIRMMSEFRKHGADAFILEVSSHALEQHRVDGVAFDVAAFTNLTAEHLDYHHTLDEYFLSKRRLFSDLLPAGTGAVNHEDGYGRRLLEEFPSLVSFGRTADADVRVAEVSVGRDGIHGVFTGCRGPVTVASSLIGDFNVSNLLAAVAVAQQLNIADEVIERGIRKMSQVPGRVEVVSNDKGVLALVDYAHTGDALEQVLKTLVKLDHARCLTVVGCGGDRDPSKRPVMARAAASYSDLAIYTSDNPRTEDPLQILEQVRAGALSGGFRELSVAEARAGEKGFVVIPDRRAAIEFACQIAGAGDLLLVAGKGHEDYQILGTRKIHFDDREELGRAFRQSSCSIPGGGGRHV